MDQIFIKKAELLNQHFTEQCTLLQNASTVPVFDFKTNNQLKSFKKWPSFKIKNLNSNKAHGWDDMSTQIIQPYWKSIALPLKLLFERVLENGKSSEDWGKKVLVHKK